MPFSGVFHGLRGSCGDFLKTLCRRTVANVSWSALLQVPNREKPYDTAAAWKLLFQNRGLHRLPPWDPKSLGTPALFKVHHHDVSLAMMRRVWRKGKNYARALPAKRGMNFELPKLHPRRHGIHTMSPLVRDEFPIEFCFIL